jgi:hypothetical protein
MKNISMIVVALVLVAIVHNYEVEAKETTIDNPIVNTIETAKDRAVNNKVTNFIKKEWNETKEFQRNSWAEGQQQVQRNKEQLTNYWDTLAEAWVYYFQPKDLVDHNTHSVND